MLYLTPRLVLACLFVNPTAGFYTSKTNDPDVGNKTIDGAINTNIDLGINYFFTNHWAVTFELANILAYNSYNPENADTSNDLEVIISLFKNIFDQPTIGVLYRW